MKIYVGDRFYKEFSDDDKEDFRIVKIKNENTFRIKYTNGELDTITRDVIEKEYVRLIPDGLIAMNIVNVGKVRPEDKEELKDVIVAIYKTEDLDNGVNLPFAVCRQSIEDLFTKQINSNPYIQYAGMSMNQNNVPAGCDFIMLLSCNGIAYSIGCSVYLDDTLDDILGLINTKKFDDVLSSMYAKIDKNRVYGYYPTVKELLENNDFMFDFRQSFNIEKVYFPMKINEEDYSMDLEQVKILEDIVHFIMENPYVIPFSRDIDLDDIKRSYLLVSDTNDDIYIVIYDKGEYKNIAEKQNFITKREIISMVKNANKPIDEKYYK